MNTSDDPAVGRGPVIAVIGGGASGTLATICLLREAAARRVPLRVALIDRHGRHGLGRAYSTTHPAHLLNSPVSAMTTCRQRRLARSRKVTATSPTHGSPARWKRRRTAAHPQIPLR